MVKTFLLLKGCKKVRFKQSLGLSFINNENEPKYSFQSLSLAFKIHKASFDCTRYCSLFAINSHQLNFQPVSQAYWELETETLGQSVLVTTRVGSGFRQTDFLSRPEPQFPHLYNRGNNNISELWRLSLYKTLRVVSNTQWALFTI